MTYVVTDNCIQCKYTDCVDVCPTDALYEGPNFLVIHPDECVDCDMCVAECPVKAIFSEEVLPADQQHFKALNQELAHKWPNLTVSKAPLPDADAWNGRPDKIAFLQIT